MRPVRLFEASREAALRQLAEFLPRAAGHYSQFRNFDEGATGRQHVSELSPYIQRRLLSEVEILHSVLQQHTLPEAEKFLQELLWRAYWRSWLELRPQVWQDYQRQVKDSEAERAQHELYQQALRGATGLAAFDLWCQELVNTGYLHNHARLWFASIWIFSLKLPWAWGADFFHRHLLDGDAAANTLSWRWVAGLHTKGKHYLARANNIEKFSLARINASDLCEDAVPLSENLDLSIHLPPSYKEWSPALIQSQRCGLLLLGDDLALDQIELLRTRGLSAVAFLDQEGLEQQLHRSVLVRDFHAAALREGQQNWSQALARPCQTILDAATLQAWVETEQLDQLLILEPFQGPFSDALQHILLSAKLPPYSFLRRDYDLSLLPYGKKGFFDFWRMARELIERGCWPVARKLWFRDGR